MSIATQSEYNKDFYAWALHNAELVREKRFNEIDIDNIAEEIESMGRSDKRELISRLAILIAHLLKWELQPQRRGNSWKYTIKEQRIRLIDLLDESPSLKHELEVKFDHAYTQSVVIAAKETELDESSFPKQCHFTLDQCLDHQFFPE